MQRSCLALIRARNGKPSRRTSSRASARNIGRIRRRVTRNTAGSGWATVTARSRPYRWARNRSATRDACSVTFVGRADVYHWYHATRELLTQVTAAHHRTTLREFSCSQQLCDIVYYCTITQDLLDP